MIDKMKYNYELCVGNCNRLVGRNAWTNIYEYILHVHRIHTYTTQMIFKWGPFSICRPNCEWIFITFFCQPVKMPFFVLRAFFSINNLTALIFSLNLVNIFTILISRFSSHFLYTPVNFILISSYFGCSIHLFFSLFRFLLFPSGSKNASSVFCNFNWWIFAANSIHRRSF